ncbi:carbohydrate ABC transporter permease [Demequina subtropica]|uniref:carbohydrate ABC transporter permease n=1 Tax=Demequina subtropica TaxID=1638989 RepID=UPI000A8E3487
MTMSATRTPASADRPRDGEGAAPAVPSPGERRRAARRQQLVAWLFLTPVTLYLVLFYALPLWRNVDLSLRDYTLRSFITGGAEFVGLDNYREIFTDPTFPTALWNTVLFTGLSLVFQYSIGLALAVFFFRRFPLAATLRALFLVPWLLPLLVSSSVWAWMLNSDSGVVNSFLQTLGLDPVFWLTSPDWSLVSVIITNIWIGIPFNLVLLYAGLQAIPGEVYEAAALDGAGRWSIFWHITFPLLRPVSAITLLLGLVYTLKVFDIIWVMTRGGPGDSSTTLAIWSYRLGFGGGSPELSLAAAVANVLILIAFVFGLFYIRAQRKALRS